MHHLDFILQFTSDIRHVTRQGNPVADALSCLEANAMQLDSASSTVQWPSPTRCYYSTTHTVRKQSSQVRQGHYAYVHRYTPLRHLYRNTTLLRPTAVSMYGVRLPAQIVTSRYQSHLMTDYISFFSGLE